MKRRDLMKAAGAFAATSLAAPTLSLAAASKTLRFVPQADLPNMDPIVGTQLVVRNASLLVYDMLYGTDSKVEAQPQMAEGHELSDDHKTWTFRLRTGLKFHDNTPVLARDCVASLKRWMVRDTLGQRLASQMDAIETVDDRNFRIRLKKPFPLMLFALGKNGTNVPVIMPERIASLDPFKIVPEYIGSGPMSFKRDEWLVGSKAVFERFAAYQPRQEKSDWLAGAKTMLLDRVEWITMPDSGTATAAIQSGEIDWWEQPVADVVPLMKRNKDIHVDIADPFGNVGVFRMNFLHPPFNDVRIRRAVQMVLSQEDNMRAVVGDDTTLWKTMPSFFTPGTPTYTEMGGEPLKGPRRYDEAKKLLKEAGYDGRPVVMLVAADVPITKAQGDVAADMLQRLGMKVDYQAVDWGTQGARRASKAAPDKGGWNIFFTWSPGATTINPAGYSALDAGGDTAWFGWPKSDEVQADIATWYDAPDEKAQQAAMDATNKASMEVVTYIPTGFFLSNTAWRSNVKGIIQSPFPIFWNVEKT
ncbi:ABC transporter substrate-binding protein [Acidisphaera sp. L21]|uniref:ABC transporter substrate-binding protein n=1 Tax=Acidisphaera sp. L21 TaxID=1641851 RepID=UPI00131BE519|nr:ABC transporter substrate-binding protein [Acidisphaera sp. L21]